MIPDAVECEAAEWLDTGDTLVRRGINQVKCLGDRESWRFWRLLLQEPAKSIWWNGRPFYSWQDVEAIDLRLCSRTDDAGRPVWVSDDEYDAAILAARWPGVQFILPPAPPTPTPP